MNLENRDPSVPTDVPEAEAVPYEAPKVQSIKLSEEAAEALT